MNKVENKLIIQKNYEITCMVLLYNLEFLFQQIAGIRMLSDSLLLHALRPHVFRDLLKKGRGVNNSDMGTLSI